MTLKLLPTFVRPLRRLAALAIFHAPLLASPGNRLAYLDERSPFYVDAAFPKLTTPMWIGEEGVDAAIVVSIDDLTDENISRFESFLAPVIARLKEIQGYSPVSIFTNRIRPDHPRLKEWLEAGLVLDVHTRSHPCPLMSRGLAGAEGEVIECIEALDRVPGNRAACFRMPCCDSINSATPLFFTEIFPRTTLAGAFLEADSSVLMFPEESYRAYAPFPNFAATALGYPYPYAIDRVVWELPIIAPTDWQAQRRRGVFHPETVADKKRAVDLIVAAKGLYTWCFHPHGWIRPEQVVEVIDYAAATYGQRVRFLTTREVVERLTRHALGGEPLRSADGSDNGVRLLDLDADGFLDVVIGNDRAQRTRRWDPAAKAWREREFPFRMVSRAGGGAGRASGVRFGVLRADGKASALLLDGEASGLAHFDGDRWVSADPRRLRGLLAGGAPVRSAIDGRDRGVRLRDLDGDGIAELLVNNEAQNAAFRWVAATEAFEPLPAPLPAAASIVDADGRDRGLRFRDLDLDGREDVLLSNDDEYYVYLFEERTGAWTRRVLHGAAGAVGALPKFVSAGRDRGAWFQGRSLYVANDETFKLPDLVEVRRLDFLIEHKADAPLDPEEALERFRLPPGFRIELAAAEPEVQDPISIEFGADGRVWVAEMGSYPLAGPGADGRVRVLRDADGDGRFEKSVVFARGLSFPAGALPFRDGVLVSCAPDILYLEDLDGDDRSDRSRVLFNGFGEGNQQHRVNGLHYGIDNWIYGANGDSGGEIRAAARPEPAPISIRGRDFRFSLDLERFEAVSGRTQYGLAMDDFGNRFGASNARHLMHAVLPERYLARNPAARPPDPVADVPDHGAMAPVFQTSRQLLSLNGIHVPGHMSSTCGLSIYRAARFPEAYRGSAFVCEPVANLVHRDVLVRRGAAFIAERGEAGSEFLTSTDTWFRPVYTATGPDDSLWVVDMYRAVVEHPQYIPREIQEILDFGAGRDRGRIYRVVYGAEPAGSAALDLRSAGADALAEALESANGVRRDAAQRLILERGEAVLAPRLAAIAVRGASAPAKVHALWTLEGLGRLDPETVLAALDDDHPAVREHALRLAEPRLGAGERLQRAAIGLVRDAHAGVRLQAAFTLGEVDGPLASEALSGLLIADGGDRWLRAAVLSSASRHAGALLGGLLDRERTASADWMPDAIAGLVRTVAASASDAELESVILALARDERAAGRSLGVLAALLDAKGEAVEAAMSRLALDQPAVRRLRGEARRLALRAEAALEQRIQAVGALGLDLVRDRELRAALLAPSSPVEVALAAVRGLSRAAAIDAEGAAAALLAAWPASGPAARGEIVEALLARPRGQRSLIAALERGVIAPVEIDAAARARLRAGADEEVRAAAARLFAAAVPAQRREVVSRYLRELEGRRGDAERGRAVFSTHCAPCHRLEGIGHRVGPDIADSRGKDAAYLLEAVLNPGGMVPPRYAQYLVATRAGAAATGIIAVETSAAITLARAGGVTETIPRQDIARLERLDGSLMPLELEKSISPEGMADLVAFIRSAPAKLGEIGPAAAAAARREVLESAHNGLARVLKSHAREPQESWVGRVSMAYIRQLDGTHELAWETAPVPAEAAAGAFAVFRLPAAMGYRSMPSGRFTLFLGERKLLEFDVALESESWRSGDGRSSLSFHVRARNDEDATGILVIEIPSDLVSPGKPAVFRVVGSNAGSRRWFGVLPLQDGASP